MRKENKIYIFINTLLINEFEHYSLNEICLIQYNIYTFLNHISHHVHYVSYFVESDKSR